MNTQQIKADVVAFADRLSRREKQVLLTLVDILILAGMAALAFLFRLGFAYDLNFSQITMILAAPVIAIPLFMQFGLYRTVLRYLPERAVFGVFKAVALSTLLWTALAFFTGSYGGQGVPRSVPFLYGVLAFLSVTLVRFGVKWILIDSVSDRGLRRTLIYGAGTIGTQVALGLRQSREANILGFVDDNPDLAGRDIAGMRVYSPAELEAAISNLGIEEIILCVPSMQGSKRLKIATFLAQFPVTVKMLPTSNLRPGRAVTASSLDRLDVGELIGRSPVPPDLDLIDSVIRGKRVLITGAGGSIGSQLARLVDANGPAELFLLDNSEYALYQVVQALNNARHTYPMHALLGSVANHAFMKRILERNHIDVVFHAAAYKHVDLVEQNVREGIRNNILGTEIVTELAYNSGVKTFVLISSDKAVNPASVMGASKRVGELILRKYAETAAVNRTGQKFLTVRFGNVIGSSGSVVPLFARQIAQGGPVTVTDTQVSRYFMAAAEAVELIVQSAGLSTGGETFVLDMGEPVSIYELARDMIELSGSKPRDDANPGGDIEIEIIGLRPGEKLHEELWYDSGMTTRTSHRKIMMAKRNTDAHLFVDRILARLKGAVEELDEGELRTLLLRLTSDANGDRLQPQVIPLIPVAKSSAG